MFDTVSLDGEDEKSDCGQLNKYLYARTPLKSILFMSLCRIVTRKVLRRSIELYKRILMQHLEWKIESLFTPLISFT